MQIMQLPPGYMSYADLDHGVGIDHTDHLTEAWKNLIKTFPYTHRHCREN